ncbi:MAG: hypothetical protein PVI57_21105 [Gemmatimonadota bacterium]|jgi:hypothetical protein
MRRGLSFAMLLGLVGCYTYAPVAPSAVPSSGDVQVRLTPAESARVAETMGWDDGVRALRGVVRGGADTLLLAVTYEPNGTGRARRGLREVVPILRSGIESAEVSRFSVGRTSALAGLGIVVAGAIVEAQMRGEEGTGGEEPGGTDQQWVTWIRIRW